MAGAEAHRLQTDYPAVDKHIIERRNGRRPGLAGALHQEKAQIKLL